MTYLVNLYGDEDDEVMVDQLDQAIDQSDQVLDQPDSEKLFEKVFDQPEKVSS